MTNIKEIEGRFQKLHNRLLRGELDEDRFKAEVERLRFEDDQGRQWKIGWYTGKWYHYEEGQWVRGQPRQRERSATAAASATEKAAAKRRPGYWLVPVLVGLVALAVVALVAGWNTDWWTSPTEGAIGAVEATATASPSPTLMPTDTPLPAATQRPSPTPTAAQHTPEPSPTATNAPVTATPSPSPTPTATATSEPAGPAPTAPPALTGRIYFPVYDSERRTLDIHVYQLADGTRSVLVEKAGQPALSPNGERLAFRSWESNYRAIRVRELDDGHIWTWVNFSEAARPSWSPDSENIVFPSQQEPDRQWRIYRTLGSEMDRVRRHGGDILGRVPIWLSDGRIVYWECPLNECGLYVMQSDGTSPTRLTTFEHDTAPAGSPDGDQIAFMSNRAGNWEIYVTTAQPPGGQAPPNPRRLTQNPAHDGLPAWSPDGAWIAFVSNQGGAWAIWAVQADGSGLHKLLIVGGPLEGPIAQVKPDEQHGWTWESIAWGP